MNVILTDYGRAKLISASPEDQLKVTRIAVADGAGTYPPLRPNRTGLIGQWWQGEASAPIRDDENPLMLTFEGMIPPTVPTSGIRTVREVGIFDAGGMIAIGHVPALDKPALTADAGFSMTVRLHVLFDETAQVDLVYVDFGPIDHQGLVNRSAAGAHPASSITVDALPIFSGAAHVQAVLAALGAASKMGTTASRTSSSTTTLLQAKAMADHVASGDHDDRYPQRANNLSDLPNAATARSNLGLGSAATMGTTASRTSASTTTVLQAKAMADHVASGDHDDRYTQRANNLSDLTNAATARSNLGLGSAATRNVGEGANDVMPVGAFGLGVNGGYRVPNNDCNQVSLSGFYSLQTAGITNTWPGQVSGDALIHCAYNSGNGFQIGGSRSNTAYIRYLSGGTWGPWRELYHSGNQLALGTTAADGRSSLGLGSAATRDVGESANNVMPVGAFGLGSDATLSNDWDSINKTGFYFNSNGGATGAPVTLSQLAVIHIEHSGSNATQIAFRTGGDGWQTWRRARDSSGWKSWGELYHSGNQLALGTTAAAGRSALGLGASATMGTTASRTSSSTTTVLQAKAMADHVGSSDHDNQYWTRSQPTASDLNNLPDNGTYAVSVSTSNAPFSYGCVIQMSRSSSRRVQIAIEDGGASVNTKTFTRVEGSSGWGAWVESWTSENQLALGRTPTVARGALELGTAAQQSDTRYAHRGNNLSDVNATLARSNLGLGTAAQQSDVRYAHRGNNLSDVNATLARNNLGLGSAAVQPDDRYMHRSQFSYNYGQQSGWDRNDHTGFIMQWGTSAAVAGDQNATITFPIRFPNNCWKVIPAIRNAAPGDDEVFARVVGWDLGTCTLRADICSPTSSVAGTQRFLEFIAIGN